MVCLLSGLSKGKNEKSTLKLLNIDSYFLQNYQKLHFKHHRLHFQLSLRNDEDDKGLSLFHTSWSSQMTAFQELFLRQNFRSNFEFLGWEKGNMENSGASPVSFAAGEHEHVQLWVTGGMTEMHISQG